MSAHPLRTLLVAALLTMPVMATAQGSEDAQAGSQAGSGDRPIAQVTARLAYNTESEWVAGLGLRTDRLFGTNQSLSLDAEATRGGGRLSFNYVNDAVAGGSPRFGLRLFRSDRRAGDVYSFASHVTGIVPRLTWSLGPSGSVSAYGMYTLSHVGNPGPAPSALIAADVGTQTSTVAGTEVNLRYPGTGGALRDTRFVFDLAVGATSRGHRYLRYSARVSMLHAFSEGNVVLRSQFRVGAIDTLSGASSIGDRYMLGDGSIRGFAFGGFGPRDLAANGAALGGNRFAVVRLDAQFPNLFGAADGRVVPGIFVDAGSLWGLDNTAGGPGGLDRVDARARLRGAAGLTLRIRTGIGPVELYVAHPFARQAYDRTQTVGLSFSRMF